MKFLAILCVICLFVNLPAPHVFAKNNSDVKVEIQQKSVRCKNCPGGCLIKTGEISPCGQYKNIDGKLVPIKK